MTVEKPPDTAGRKLNAMASAQQSRQFNQCDRLFDRRALHILNRNRSAAHRPGERFIVYKLDYGLYVDLASTDKFPVGLLLDDSIAHDIDFGVPSDDARSYRRAILELDKFYEAHQDIMKT